MNSVGRLYNKIVLGHPLLVLLLAIVVLGFFSYYAKEFRLDASADSLLLEDDRDLQLSYKSSNFHMTEECY